MKATSASVLILGIDPESMLEAGIEMDAPLIKSVLAHEQGRFAQAGIDADLCFVGFDESAEQRITDALRRKPYACVVVGGGIRKPPAMLPMFESVINLIRRHAPDAAIAFNTSGGDSLDAARRWL